VPAGLPLFEVNQIGWYPGGFQDEGFSVIEMTLAALAILINSQPVIFKLTTHY
jgi:hypothetical protein